MRCRFLQCHKQSHNIFFRVTFVSYTLFVWSYVYHPVIFVVSKVPAHSPTLNRNLLKSKTQRYNVSISTIQDGVSKMYAGSINFANDKPSGKILSTIAQPASYKNYTNGAGITTMIAGDLLICGTLYPDGDTWLEIDVIWLYIYNHAIGKQRLQDKISVVFNVEKNTFPASSM